MNTKNPSPWLAATTTAGVLLTMVFATGCQTNMRSIPHPPQEAKDCKGDPNSIPHPPNDTRDPKDGPVRHRHHRMMAPVQSGGPAPITHPGG